MPTPAIITTLEQQLSITIAPSDAPDLHAFMRYGRKEEDKSQYWLKDGTLTGLKLRTLGLQDASFLGAPELSGLQGLYLAENDFSSLQLPASLQQLQLLNLADDKALQTLEFAGAMPQLEEIDLSDSGIQALHLPDCPALQKLDVSRSKLEAFSFASACPKLWWLDLSGNEGLKEVNLPNGCDALKFLHLSNCNMEQLQIGGALPNLQVLDLKGNQLSHLPADVVLDSPLETLYAKGSHPKNIPWVFLEEENSLEEARIWFQELRDYPHEVNKTVKLMITGNGNVGKTTLMSALQSEEGRCTYEHPSTHGIQIGVWEERGIRYNYWDFGGQEVYHGTHRLFLASEALQLIVFDPETEALARKQKPVKDRIRAEEETFNHPLPYWYETAKQISPRSQFLVVQNKIDLFEEEDEEVMQYAKGHKLKTCTVDAKTGTDIEDIPHQLKKLVRQLPEYNMAMPASWLEVRQYFIDNMEADKPERLVSKAFFFDQLCEGVPKKSQPLLLKYLHHAGYLYTHDNLGDNIIADQRWALDAIYKPLERSEAHYQEFRQQDRGKIRVWRLFEEFGEAYSEQEKWLFLSFMESCGLCFELNRTKGEREQRSLSDVYVFPEFLPLQEPEAVKAEWRNQTNLVTLKYQMPWVDYSLVQAFICRLGRKAPLHDIWRNGINIRTGEGKFKVHLDYPGKQLLIQIQREATGKWLKPILEEFPRDMDWQISEGGGAAFQPFDLDKFQRSGLSSKIAPTEEEQKIESLTKGLDDVKQEFDQEVMLLLAANPVSTQKLSYKDEHSDIINELDDDQLAGRIKVSRVDNANLIKLNKEIDIKKPAIIHFVGHGEDGSIIFAGDNPRDSDELSAKDLKNIFQRICQCYEAGEQLKIIFLNACFSEPVAKALSSLGLYTLGTVNKVSSVTARRVAMQFYWKYAQSRDVIEAAKFAFSTVTTSDPNFRLFKDGQEIPLYHGD